MGQQLKLSGQAYEFGGHRDEPAAGLGGASPHGSRVCGAIAGAGAAAEIAAASSGCAVDALPMKPVQQGLCHLSGSVLAYQPPVAPLPVAVGEP